MLIEIWFEYSPFKSKHTSIDIPLSMIIGTHLIFTSHSSLFQSKK